jgi:hypothetical protein
MFTADLPLITFEIVLIVFSHLIPEFERIVSGILRDIDSELSSKVIHCHSEVIIRLKVDGEFDLVVLDKRPRVNVDRRLLYPVDARIVYPVAAIH